MLPRSPQASVLSTGPLTSFPYVLAPQTDSVWEWCPSLHIPHSCWILLKTYCRIKIAELGGVQSWCSGTAWARHPRGSNVITVFVHIPTLRIWAGCQCPRCTRSWPSSREVMVTGSTSFLSLRDKVLFCILCYTPFPMTSDRAKLSKYGRNGANMNETEQICTQWYRVPKVWTMPFWASSSAQSSSRCQVWTAPYSLN